MSKKTAMEKDAINKGLLAYFLTDSPLLGWLVYRKNDLTLKELASLCDAYYTGGTKNGALFEKRCEH